MSAITAPLRRSRPTPETTASVQLRVVDEPVVRHTLAYAVVMVLILAAAVFGAVSLNALAAGASVEARALEAQVDVAEREYARLIAEVATLEDPARVRAAAEELGMVAPGPVRHLTLERNLSGDGAAPIGRSSDATTDPLKPLLSVEH